MIFDIDNTLYDNDSYVLSQTRLLVTRFARERSISVAAAGKRIEHARRAVAERSGKRTTSIGNAMVELGVSIEQNAAWRSELFRPERYLAADPILRRTLESIAGWATIGALTNNSMEIAYRTLRVLGVEDLFEGVVGLDTLYESKPSAGPFLHLLDELACPPEFAVSVGDRYEIDIAPALSLGMGAIEVDSVSDVYLIPSVSLG